MSIWVDEGLVGGAASVVSALDHGVTVGDGIFETCLVTGGRAFALTRHLRRLERSAATIGLTLPDADLLDRAIAAVLDDDPLDHGRLRITVTSGEGPLGSGRGQAPPTLVVASTPAAPWAEHQSVVTVPWTRNERSAVAGAKTTSYAENVVALAEAHRRGAHEALLANTRGELCEGTGANVVVLLDGELLTPPLSSGCLAGVTRELLLEWAARDGLRIVEKDLPFEVLGEAEAVLLTSSTRGVQPQSRVDGRALSTAGLASAAAELFDRRAAEGIDP